MKKIYTRVIILLTFIGSSCSDETLEKLPKDQLTVSTTFTTNSNFETYAWSMYANSFPGYWDLTPINREMGSDLLVNNAGTQGDELLWQRKTVPSSSSLWSNSYINIRRANLMLDNIDNSELTDGEKQHWKGVGLFSEPMNTCS